jgi:fumarate hydratase subunit alpha
MREIPATRITDLVANLCQTANTDLGDDVKEALRRALANEQSPVGRECLQRLIENAEIAPAESMPICQDTGMAIIFVEYGQQAVIKDGDFVQAIDEGVRRGYKLGYLRK